MTTEQKGAAEADLQPTHAELFCRILEGIEQAEQTWELTFPAAFLLPIASALGAMREGPTPLDLQGRYTFGDESVAVLACGEHTWRVWEPAEECYLIARHDGPGGYRDVTPYLGFSWHIVSERKLYPLTVPSGLVLLGGLARDAEWMAQRLASGMLLRNGDGRGIAPYQDRAAALVAIAEYAQWWVK